MKLQYYNYTCANCGHRFKVLKMCFFPYGEFLLRSKSNELSYLNAIEDSVYEEVDSLLEKIPGYKRKSDDERAEILQSVFGAACDSDVNGNSFSINAEPLCPSCGENEIQNWEATMPPEYEEREVFHVTHKKWSSLSEIEQMDLLKKELLNYEENGDKYKGHP